MITWLQLFCEPSVLAHAAVLTLDEYDDAAENDNPRFYAVSFALHEVSPLTLRALTRDFSSS